MLGEEDSLSSPQPATPRGSGATLTATPRRSRVAAPRPPAPVLKAAHGVLRPPPSEVRAATARALGGKAGAALPPPPVTKRARGKQTVPPPPPVRVDAETAVEVLRVVTPSSVAAVEAPAPPPARPLFAASAAALLLSPRDASVDGALVEFLVATPPFAADFFGEAGLLL